MERLWLIPTTENSCLFALFCKKVDYANFPAVSRYFEFSKFGFDVY